MLVSTESMALANLRANRFVHLLKRDGRARPFQTAADVVDRGGREQRRRPKKDAFIGSDVLKAQKTQGVARKLVAFEMRDRAIARHGYPVVRGGLTVGVVTSGTQTPFLKKAVGLAMVPSEMASVGMRLDIEIRGRVAAAEVVPEPFYKRPGKG